MLKTVPDLVAEARTHLRCVNAATAMEEIKASGGTIVDVRELVEVNNLAAPRCATGGRATLAAAQLVKMGYTNVSVVTCPIDTVKEAQELFVD